MNAANQALTRFVASRHFSDVSMTPATLRALFNAARSTGKRAKEAAETLGVSEGEAVAAHAGIHDYGLEATALRGPWAELLQSLQSCGPMMALTRNESTVHEKTGIYQNVSAFGDIGLALGEDIDLRLFFNRWHAGFALFEPANDPKNPPSQSLQFFNQHGVAVHKIFVRAETDREAFNAIVKKFSDTEKSYVFTPAPARKALKSDAQIDVAGLAQSWSDMTDTHQFFGLTAKYGVERQQAFRLVEGRFTERADPGIVRRLLDEAVIDGVSIMVFVSSDGCIQIHSGPVRRIEPLVTPTAQWLNVLDAGFNLHLREDMIKGAWIVQKPTDDGVVTSVEVFDIQGELMVMFFGSRKPGVPEQPAWRDLVARLPRLPGLD
jgi:putative hemin transport protein